MSNLIEGRNPVLEALRSGRTIGKIWLAKNCARHGAIAEIIHIARTKNILIEYVEPSAINRLSETRASQGVIAFASAKDYVDLDTLLSISQTRGEPAIYLILDGIEDPHNLGAILRTADAAGLHGVIVRERRAVGLTPAVEKAAAGALEYVAVAKVVNIAQTIVTLKQNNIWIVGIDQAGDINYRLLDYRPPTAIVIGGEGQGLSELVKKRCDFLACIPMRGHIASLNASVAAGVVMYEAVKQREARGA